ncbi:MAG: hypothetical protein RLZZ200_1096 [Pseudomonadota bacterium]|jgi:hypothetical protein
MRSLPAFVTLLVAASLGAAEAYRWVDKDGVVHFSDKPAPGAESITLTPAPKPGSVTQTYTPSAPRPSEAPTDTRYDSCQITSPGRDQTFGIADPVSIAIDATPALQPGDRLQVTLNGARIEDWPDGSSTHTLSGLPRGEYTVRAVVTGPSGTVKCTTAASRFNVFQPSLLSPGRARR